jgi:predicted aspartyl protease
MIRYSYNCQVEPPAPFVHVSLRCPETGKAVDDLPAQIDTAADRTVIPANLVELLELLPLDELPVAGFGGQVFVIPTYLVGLALRTFVAAPVEVFAHPEEPFILLGRDVLNRLRLLLDGPALAFEIG